MIEKRLDHREKSIDALELRQRAEEQARTMEPISLSVLTPEEIHWVFHELRVRQIELEMQKEELRSAQARVEAGQARYFELYDLAPVGYCTLSEQGLILEANLTAATLLGVTRSALVMRSISRFICKEDQNIYYQHRLQLLETGAPQKCDLRLVQPDGGFIWAHFTGVVAQAEDGKPVCRVVLSDITERKQVEDALQATMYELKKSQEVARVGNWVWHVPQNLVEWSDEMYRIFGIEKDQFTGDLAQVISDSIHPEDRAGVDRSNASVMESNTPVPLEYRVVRPDGSVRFVWAEAGELELDGVGKPLLLRGIVHDITDRKEAEVALRESEEKYRSLFSQSTEGIYLHDFEGRILDVNQMACTQSGYSREELLGLTVFDFHPSKNTTNLLKDEILLAWRQLTPDQRVVVNIEHQRKDGTVYPVDISTGIVCYGGTNAVLAIVKDITERKKGEAEQEKLQAQLAQAQKMESVGRLAGGVAHDFNNMLGVILGHTEMVLQQVSSDEPLHANLEAIQEAAKRSADLTGQLLAYARKQTVAPRVVDLNDTIEKMLNLLRRLIGEDIDLAWQPGRRVWPIKMDTAQIDKILVNLVVNSRDAIAGVGKVTIETGNASFDEEYCSRNAGFVPGDHVLLSVSDNGCGMDAQTRAQIFEPFFTTKEIGKGTGLGLATVYGAVKQNNGFINFNTEPGLGTTFMIYLPRHALKAGLETEENRPKVAARGSETVLLVEDEPAILTMTTMMLQRMGYTVLAAGTPDEAIRLAQEHPGRIDMLMTDVVMPEMNGRDLAKNLLYIYPDIRRLFMSGYTADVIAHHGVLDEGVHFIQKPFTLKDLETKLREVLER